MKFVVWLLVCAVCVLAEESPPPQTSPDESPPPIPTVQTTLPYRSSRFINLYDTSIETNQVTPEEKQEPSSALEGIYSDCVLKFSLACLQKKFLVFLDKLGRMDGFSLFGDFLSVKRTSKEKMKPISEKVIDARMNSEDELNSLVEFSIDRFFSTHKFHVKLPFGMTIIDDHPLGRSIRTERNTIDIGFPDDYASEGRTKKLIRKKIITLIVMLAKAKLAFLVPLAVILIKIKAVKALIFAKLALFLAIFSAIKKAGLGAAGLGALGLGGAGLGAAGLGAASLGASSGGQAVQSVGTTYTQTGQVTGSHTTGGSKIVIIHDPHHVGGHGHSHGGHGHGGHSHGHSASTGYDGYGPSGGAGGGYSSGGDSYGVGGGGGGGGGYHGGGGGSGGGYHDGGGWGRSWSPTDPSNAGFRHNSTASTKPTT